MGWESTSSAGIEMESNIWKERIGCASKDQVIPMLHYSKCWVHNITGVYGGNITLSLGTDIVSSWV